MTPTPGPLADVTAEAPDPPGGGWTLVFIRDLRHAPDRVWAALTEPAQLRAWAPFVPDRDLATAGPATLTMIDADSPEDTAAVVRRAEPPTLLEYTWGGDLLRWELTPAGAGTRLTLRHRVADRDWLPKVAAGWHLCLDVAERLLAGSPVPPIRGEDARNHGWDELAEEYAAKLGDS
jgi:uncharacterized protein YndB with AHSA1/START domain